LREGQISSWSSSFKSGKIVLELGFGEGGLPWRCVRSISNDWSSEISGCSESWSSRTVSPASNTIRRIWSRDKMI
jgi:hypothetical protein